MNPKRSGLWSRRWNLFGRILLRLTAVNTLVLLSVFILYNVFLYGIIRHQLYDNVDTAMQNMNQFLIRMTRNENAASRPLRFPPPAPPDTPDDPRVQLLFLNAQGERVSPPLQGRLSAEEIAEFTAAASATPQSRERRGHHYRFVKFVCPDDALPQVTLENRLVPVRAVIYLANVDPEIRLLHTVMTLSTAGTLLVFLIIVAAGYFLARRALIPINQSWEKQEQFVSNASHEMRTPLAVVKAHAELLLHHPSHTVEQESAHIASILRESTRLGNLVAKLLLLARADSNQEELDLQPLELADLAGDVITRFQPMADLQGVRLTLTAASPLPVTGDRDRLIQLLVILLDNAVKHTPSGGSVNLSFQSHSGQARLVLTDTGCGISPQDLPHIFDRFYRADTARSGPERGSGLGLSIARWIAESHRGSIKAQSVPGKGTTFTVTLPLRK